MISAMNSSLSALQAFSKKTESIADNVANVNSDGFKKTRVTLREDGQNNVTPLVSRIENPGPLVYEQTADGEILVEKSNVDISEELPEMILTRRFYQANIKMVQIQDDMLGSLLDIKKA